MSGNNSSEQPTDNIVLEEDLFEDHFAALSRIRPSGIVRPGINTAPENAARKKPKNVDYLTLDPDTFHAKGDVEVLTNLYADSQGRITSLPIWFHSDDLSIVAPFGYGWFKGGGVPYCSSTGRQKGKLVARRTNDKGQIEKMICDPKTCPAFNKTPKDCKFQGALFFYVPGQRGAAPLALYTHSWNSWRNIWSALTSITAFRGGISRMHNGSPFLALTKISQKVLKYEDGRPSRVPQFLVNLELLVDPTPMVNPFFSVAGKAHTAPPATEAQPWEEEAAQPPSAENGDISGQGTSPNPPEAEKSSGAAPTPASPAPPPRSKQELFKDMRTSMKMLGLSDEDMKIWATRIARQPVAGMNEKDLTELVCLMESAVTGRSETIRLEIRLAKLLDLMDLSLSDLNFWLLAKVSMPWSDLSLRPDATNILVQMENRAGQEMAELKAEIEVVASKARGKAA